LAVLVAERHRQRRRFPGSIDLEQVSAPHRHHPPFGALIFATTVSGLPRTIPLPAFPIIHEAADANADDCAARDDRAQRTGPRPR
jgi:hypothetical protein